MEVCKCASALTLMQIFMKLLPSWVQRRVDHRGRVSVVGKLGCHQVRHYRTLQALPTGTIERLKGIQGTGNGFS